MVKIPRIGPGSTKLTTQTGVAPRDPGKMTQVSRAVSDFAKVAESVAQKFEVLATDNEVAKSKNIARQQMADLILEREQDPDTSIDNQNSYKGRLEKIKEETISGISLPYAKNEYGQWFDSSALVADTKIKSQFRAKQIAESKVEMDNTVKSLGKIWISGERETAKQELDREIAKKAELGYWNTDAEKQKFRDDTIKGWRLREIDDDIENSENFVVDELMKGDKGVYSDIDPEDRRKKLAIARAERNRKIAIRRRNDKIQANAVTTQLTLSALDPAGTGVSFQELENASKLKNSEGTQLLTDADLRVISRLKVSKKKIGAVAHPPTYRKLYAIQKSIIENKDENVVFADIARFRNDAIEAVSDGKLTESRAKLWIEQTEALFQSKLKKEDLKGMQSSLAISRWFSKNLAKNKRLLPYHLSKKQQDETFMNMNNKLMDRIEPSKEYSNAEINKIATEIWNAEVIQNYPEVLGSGGIPNYLATKDGGVTPISPNSVNIKTTVKSKPVNKTIQFKAPDGKIYTTLESNKAAVEAKEGYEIVG